MVVEGGCRNTPGRLSAAYRVEPDSEADLVRCFHRDSVFEAVEIDATDGWPAAVLPD